jgi:hypothetical protein
MAVGQEGRGTAEADMEVGWGGQGDGEGDDKRSPTYEGISQPPVET